MAARAETRRGDVDPDLPAARALGPLGRPDRQLGLGAGCVGYVTRQPDFILHMTGDSSALSVNVNVPGARAVSPTDTTLVVNDPHGGWHCNDDTNGANPRVELHNLGAGQYDIWIGAYQANTRARGTLNITEL